LASKCCLTCVSIFLSSPNSFLHFSFRGHNICYNLIKYYSFVPCRLAGNRQLPLSKIGMFTANAIDIRHFTTIINICTLSVSCFKHTLNFSISEENHLVVFTKECTPILPEKNVLMLILLCLLMNRLDRNSMSIRILAD
jgi:hypothetical protein